MNRRNFVRTAAAVAAALGAKAAGAETVRETLERQAR